MTSREDGADWMITAMSFDEIKSELLSEGDFTLEELNKMGTLAICYEWLRLPIKA